MATDPRTDAFFKLHRELPREGPGSHEDIAWVASVLDVPPTARIADVACGPGGDIAGLLGIAPRAHVTALDKTPHFVEAARTAWKGDDRVTVLKADMKVIANSYDLIWCAGAVYFIGIATALSSWRKSLLPDGAIAFSEVCWFTQTPSPRPAAMWARDYPAMTDEAGVSAQITQAGYTIVGQRRLDAAAWEAYYTPLEARIDQLRGDADPVLTEVLDEAQAEIACWRAHSDEFGYLISVVTPA